MATAQTILFTIMPRGISLNGETMPVSVFVAPRLYGADTLGAFDDWLHWTERLKDNGLTLVLRCGANSLDAPINTSPLRPELWAQLFHEDTLVRSHTFDDYTGRGIISYGVRETLSALKTIYQEASVRLALPDSPARQSRDDGGNRGVLRELVEGLDVHWNGNDAKRWREAVRRMNASSPFAGVRQSVTGSLDAEGLIVRQRDPNTFRKVAVPFAVFHHMPTPERKLGLDEQTNTLAKPDTDKLLDFHQALSSLNAYPDLLRALGIVFDLDLPRDFVTQTPLGQFGTIAVRRVGAGWDWAIEPKTPELATAYVHMQIGDQRLFLTAPRALSDPSSPTTIIGLLSLDPTRFGLAQVDVDGGMHKTIILAETLHNPDPQRNLDPFAQPEPAPHPEVFDPEATLPSLRSGGFSLFADRRSLQLLDNLQQSKTFNQAVESGGAQPRPFFAEDLVRGYRLDVWDSRTSDWHSLHRRSGAYQIGDETFATEVEEGFVQLALTQPAKGAEPVTNDLYLHEAIARWAGWSLSVQRPGKHLSRYADPDKAVPPDGDDPDFREDQPDTPFKMTTRYQVLPSSLPRLRFGARYRLRARAMDLAGNSLQVGDPLANALSLALALPRDPEGSTYLRYEPVIAPLVVLRDEKAVTEPGSAIDRIVIRTFNADPTQDTLAADTLAADRHIVPPRTSVEMGERLGMFDDASGNLKSDPATWQLIAARDAGELNKATIDVAGKTDEYPLEAAERIDALPYLPDPLARGAAIRDLPGTPSAVIGKAIPNTGASGPIPYDALSDPNPRPGSVTLIRFNNGEDWQQTTGFRLMLAEPEPDQTDLRPHWDAPNRLLTVYLPKGQTTVVPLSSYLNVDDLKLIGVWQWLREYIERITITEAQPQYLLPGTTRDEIAHILQRAVEGGHWMLTPPRLLTLVHAVQQPIGRPSFAAIRLEHEVVKWDQNPLQTAPLRGRADPSELAPITAWRRPGANEAYLMGALRVHGASTAKVDVRATWTDPLDDPTQPTWTTTQHAAHVDEVPLHDTREGYLIASGADARRVGYYDPEHDQIVFARAGDWTGKPQRNQITFDNAAPRHLLNDTKRHRVTYRAIATSRYREYFPQDLDFTRESEPIVVDVPASARPLAPNVAYVIPTFGWERQTETNLKRSVRFGGGLRVYLHRSWFSSGEGELLGVALWGTQSGVLTEAQRDKFKPFITQWGMDPIWQTGGLLGAPSIGNFADFTAYGMSVTLEESSARGAKGAPGRIDVVGFTPEFDEARGLWFADLILNTFTETYMPFVRLALVRYQPHALADAIVSRVVLADFAQLTPDRSAMVTADPHHARTLRVVVSGVAPRGPQASVRGRPRPAVLSKVPTQIRVRVQQRDPYMQSDLAWREVPADVAQVKALYDARLAAQPDLELWAGTVTFKALPQPGEFRLLVEEHEYISANYTVVEGNIAQQPGRLIYAEMFTIDEALVRE